jgi:hypothetical protein
VNCEITQGAHHLNNVIQETEIKIAYHLNLKRICFLTDIMSKPLMENVFHRNPVHFDRYLKLMTFLNSRRTLDLRGKCSLCGESLCKAIAS